MTRTSLFRSSIIHVLTDHREDDTLAAEQNGSFSIDTWSDFESYRGAIRLKLIEGPAGPFSSISDQSSGGLLA
jgi:hypothetical protein